MKNNTLALDMGMDTGWAAYLSAHSIGETGVRTGGTESFKQKPQSEGLAYAAYMKWLKQTISSLKIQNVVIEDVAGRWVNKYAQRYYFGFRGITVMICEFYGLKMYSYHQMTIKKNVIGSGKADKADIVMHYRIQGINIVNDDHADALMLLDNHGMTISGQVEVKAPKKKKAKKPKG